MKPFKIFIRYWFAITSVLSFIAGWIILAHSPKPVQPTSANNSNVPQSIFPPAQTFGNGSSNGFGLFSTGPQSNLQSGQSFPRMRTGGS
jgi:hypothetical protein